MNSNFFKRKGDADLFHVFVQGDRRESDGFKKKTAR